jgi:hypothetical protein
MQTIQVVVTVTKCDECPHFDNQYWGYNERCLLLDEKIQGKINRDEDDIREFYYSKTNHPIPCNCPYLKKNDEKNTM